MGRIPREYAKFDISLTIMRDEWDMLRNIFENDNSEFGVYMMERIRLAKER